MDTTSGTLFFSNAGSVTLAAGASTSVGTPQNGISDNSVLFSGGSSIGDRTYRVSSTQFVQNTSGSSKTIYYGCFNRGDTY